MFTEGLTKTAAIGNPIKGLARGMKKVKDAFDGGAGAGRAISKPFAFTGRKRTETVRKVKDTATTLNKRFESGSREAFLEQAKKQGPEALQEAKSHYRKKDRVIGGSLAKTQERMAKRQVRKGQAIDLKTAPELKGRYRLSKHDTQKHLPNKNKERVLERAERLRNYKKGIESGPSFMSRHPLLTLGAGALIAKGVSQDSDNKDNPPQVVYPQY